jgi:hypothetical protein
MNEPRSQNRPDSPQNAPDPTQGYARENPDAEAGMGRLDNNDHATPANRPDCAPNAVKNKSARRQINAEDVSDDRATGDVEQSAVNEDAGAPNASGRPRYLAPRELGAESHPAQPEHSMKEDEPMGWDMAPTDIHNPRLQRHPRTEGKGGTPD